MDEFEIFWVAYPKRKAKADARKAWVQTDKIRPAINAILGAVESAKQSIDWRKDGGQFIPYPSSWLRGERWDDEHEIVIEQPIIKAASRAWRLSDAATIAHGNSLGIQAMPGETMQNYRSRLEKNETYN